VNKIRADRHHFMFNTKHYLPPNCNIYRMTQTGHCPGHQISSDVSWLPLNTLLNDNAALVNVASIHNAVCEHADVYLVHILVFVRKSC